MGFNQDTLGTAHITWYDVLSLESIVCIMKCENRLLNMIIVDKLF